VIEPPAFTGAEDVVELLEAVDPGDDGLLLVLLQAAAVSTSAAAPARQAVRFDRSRNFTAFTYS
jgi:hypothetical protein